MTTKELVDGCIAKNIEAQRYLFDTYSNRLLGIVVRYFNDIDDAEDVLMETFVTILKKIDTYSGHEEEKVFFGWIKKIAVNKALTKIRHDKAKHKEDRMEDDFKLISLEDTADHKLDAQYLLTMIQELPRQQRTVFNLYAIEGYSHKEIADELGISESTSKSNYSRAKDKLQVKVNKYREVYEVESN